MEMKLIDSHCHLDDFYANGELNNVLARAHVAHVENFVVIGTSAADAGINWQLAKNYGGIYYTIGTHPLCIGEEFSDFEQYFNSDNPPVAVGEIGLDYHSLVEDTRSDAIVAQKALFSSQLEIAERNDYPVVIHSREAFADTYQAIAESGINWSQVLFHCYGYGAEEMRVINELGAYVSFSGTVTYKNAKSLHDALRTANVDRLLIETDCPFLAPEPHRGKQNEPSFLQHTAKFIEEFFAGSCSSILDKIFANTVRFFSLDLK
jgi:TatD DNase family protein